MWRGLQLLATAIGGALLALIATNIAGPRMLVPMLIVAAVALIAVLATTGRRRLAGP